MIANFLKQHDLGCLDICIASFLITILPNKRIFETFCKQDTLSIKLIRNYAFLTQNFYYMIDSWFNIAAVWQRCLRTKHNYLWYVFIGNIL